MKGLITVIQARMNSSRLPGKVLMDINGKPMLWHVVNRLRKSEYVKDIIIAATTKDKEIVAFTRKNKLRCFLGSEDDVLGRFYNATVKFRLKVNPTMVIRITADCPLIDPKEVDRTVDYFLANDVDYVYNGIDGFDVEVFSRDVLERAQYRATTKEDREHVTSYIIRNYKAATLNTSKTPHLSVDTQEDLSLIRKIFQELGNDFSMEDALKLASDVVKDKNVDVGE